MKLTMRLGAAISIAALGACAQGGEGEGANMDANSGPAGEEAVLPADESSAGSDTLGNQLNQLNESDAGTNTETANEGNSI